MGLSGEEQKFLHRIRDRGPQEHFAETMRLTTDWQADRAHLDELTKKGYLRIAYTSPIYKDLIRFELTEAAKDLLRVERANSEAFSKGMAGGKAMYGNAVNRLRAKLSDKRIPSIANRLHKLFSKRTDLTEEEKALLAEMKEVLGSKSELPPQGPFQITINGKLIGGVPKNVLSYSEIVEAAGLSGNLSMVVHQFSKHQGQRSFSLSYGNTVFLEPGWQTAINIAYTGSA